MKARLESRGEAEFEVCALGRAVTLKKSMVSISREKKREHQREFTPSVIEPSFGIGRIIYCLYEHSFYTRPSKADNELLNVFGFSALVAPKKCAVLPLVKTEAFDRVAKAISRELTAAGVSNIVDITGTAADARPSAPRGAGAHPGSLRAGTSIGKRYARTDEIGVPFAVTVDSAASVTIRERDSRQQIRVDAAEAALVVKELADGQSTWADVMWRYPTHTTPTADDD